MKNGRVSGFGLSLLLTILINIGGVLPAIVLFALHYIVGFPLWLAFVALGLWLVGIIVELIFWRLMLRWSRYEEPKTVNKNPYSVGAKKPTENEIGVEKP